MSSSRAARAGFQPGVAFILVVAALDVMSMGLVMPVMPALILDLTGSNADAAWWTGVAVALWAGTQFLFSPLIGSLSARYGRRPVILISAAGLAADWALMALAPNLWWLAVARIVGGLTSSSFTACFAYMADITAPENRARAFGYVGAAFSGGFILGPALGGLLGQHDPRTPLWVAAALSAVTFLYGVLVLPESLPRERRTTVSLARANPFGALRLLASRAGLGRLTVINFLIYVAHHLFSAVFVLYTAKRYGWGPWEVGLLLALAGALDSAVQALAIGPMVRRFGDRRSMVIGLVSGAAGIAGMGLAPNAPTLVAALVVTTAWGMAMPTVQSLMTRRVSETEQGQLQGANNSVASLAGVFSPLLFGWAYGVTADSFPGAVFLVVSASVLLGAVIGAWGTDRDEPATSGAVGSQGR